MKADTSLRARGEWKTILCIASNRPMQDFMVDQEATEAGAVRVFEFQIKAPKAASSLINAQLIQLAEQNYGSAE